MIRSLVVFFLAHAVTAQEPTPAPPLTPAALLQETLARMLSLRSVAFECRLSETRSATMPFGNQKQRMQLHGVIEVGHGTQAAFGTGEHEIFVARDHCVVRRAGGPWVLRRGHLADGQPLPFVPDLLALCTCLQPVTEQAKRRDAPPTGESMHQQIELTIDGQAARELMWSGALPAPDADIDRLIVGLAIPGVEVSPPKVHYEVTVTIDAQARLIESLIVRGKKAAGDAGGVGVEFEVATPDDARKLDEFERASGKGADADKQASVEMRLTFRDFDAARLHVPPAVATLLRWNAETKGDAEAKAAPSGR
jgi:hypothetical protein